jgi:hypothetical protein
VKRLPRPAREADTGALSVAGCVHHLDGFDVRQIEILQLLDKGDVMQLFTLLSWPGKFQALDVKNKRFQKVLDFIG